LIRSTAGFGRAANSRDAGIQFAAVRKEVHFLSAHFKLRFKFEGQSSPDAWYVRAHRSMCNWQMRARNLALIVSAGEEQVSTSVDPAGQSHVQMRPSLDWLHELRYQQVLGHIKVMRDMMLRIVFFRQIPLTQCRDYR
jgi:hypothetical protein